MKKGPATFSRVDHASSRSDYIAETVQVQVNSDPLVSAVDRLTETIKALKPEVKINLPAMNPQINLPAMNPNILVPEVNPVVQVQPTPVPVSVTVPDLPPNPPVQVTIPDFPALPEHPPAKVSLGMAATIGLTLILGNVISSILDEVLRTFLHR